MSTPFDQVCARCRLAREKLFLKGEKCFTPKCPMVRRPYPPGIHGQKRRTATEYGRQLKEKQALRAMYGLRERQLRKYFEEARTEKGVTAETLLELLEARLDNAVFRLGIGASRPQARQIVHHGLIAVNGRRVDIPSYQVRLGDTVGVKASKRGTPLFADLAERTRNKPLSAWLERLDPWSGKAIGTPKLEAHEVPVDMRAIVEFYSR